MKKISALISNNSDLELLKPTISSIKNQTRKIDRIVFVNDNGKYDISDLEKILDSTKIPYTLINNKTNKGLTSSLNIGVRHCYEDYIARADAGDLWHLDKIKLQENYLNKHNDIVCVGSQCAYFKESINKILSISNFPSTKKELKKSLNFIGISPASHSSILIKKKYLTYLDLYKKSQDLDLYMRLVSSGYNISNLNKVLSYVYLDPKGISINNKPSQLRYIFRAHHNYQCRKNNIKENNIPIKDNTIWDKLWILSKPIYKLYVNLNLKKYKYIKITLLIFCLIIYPPMIPFYIFRVRVINSLRLFFYSLFK